eukprot:1558043-Amphidinium_carterae.1
MVTDAICHILGLSPVKQVMVTMVPFGLVDKHTWRALKRRQEDGSYVPNSLSLGIACLAELTSACEAAATVSQRSIQDRIGWNPNQVLGGPSKGSEMKPTVTLAAFMQ